jgi:hypothetical protein
MPKLNRSMSAFDLMKDRVSQVLAFGDESRECFLEANIDNQSYNHYRIVPGSFIFSKLMD